MSEIIQYLLRFMVGEHLPDNDEVSRWVGYTSDMTKFTDYKVVIVPSEFFDNAVYGTPKSIPALPLKTIKGVPFLFGTPDIERVGNTTVVHADLVASAYFLLSRYEELLFRDKRDEHGRFPGRQSIPFRAGFITRPVVDEYGKLIRELLNQNGVIVTEPPPSIRKINLTHDVDTPFNCRTWHQVLHHILNGKNPISAIRNKYRPLLADPYYTFPWILQQNKLLQSILGECRCQSILFFKAGGKTKNDKPRYNLKGKDVRALFDLCRELGVTVGLHSSYQAGITPSLIASEKNTLEEAYRSVITHNRHHFLSSREPEDMEYLLLAGITDDYTMGYADVAGFRLSTSLPVRFINPVSKRLTSLILHPLIIMDGTLSEKKYMNLSAEKAEDYCRLLIQNIRDVNGALTLLWHNTTIASASNYHSALYQNFVKWFVENPFEPVKSVPSVCINYEAHPHISTSPCPL